MSNMLNSIYKEKYMTHSRWMGFIQIWKLIKPYWVSEQKGRGWLLLVTIIALALGQVYISVLINSWNAAFYNALQNKNLHEFLHQLGVFTMLATAFIIVAVYQQYFTMMLHITWRKWMTEKYQTAWLSNQAYYRLQVIYKSTDNPDQRIADDIDGFTDNTLTLSIGLLSAIVTLVSFVTILWGLSGPLHFTYAGYVFSIPGYMVWAALVYSIIGTWITHKIGRRLIGLNYNQQRFEANFRFSMIRMRENAEAIAFYKGERVEAKNLHEQFSHIVQNWWQIMKKQKQLTWFTSGYSQAAIIFPVIVAAPRYFAGAIQLGGLMQTASAFGQVQGSLSWFVGVYAQFASWKATTDRLNRFIETIETSNNDNASKEIVIQKTSEQSLYVRHLQLTLPNGNLLLNSLTTQLSSGDRLLLMGVTGSGKTTFLRALAGLWSYGSGNISLPTDAKVLFIPQKPYLPILSLKEVICYPGTEDAFSDIDVTNGLIAVGLSSLAPRLQDTENWSQSLSPGEQQKLAFARILLHKPDVILLDEASASMDEQSEADLYGLLITQLPKAIVVSVGHRESLIQWHNMNMSFPI
jgi:putative ATP-binding cassette transporter